MLRWSDEMLGGKGYVNWYPFEHPQLGPVELGGWDRLDAIGNPPPAFLEQEIARFPDWVVWHLLISPRLELFEATAEPLGNGCYRVRMVVQNTGWLPTYVTKKALEKKVVRGVICAIGAAAGRASCRPEKAGRRSGSWKGERTSHRCWMMRTPPTTGQR